MEYQQRSRSRGTVDMPWVDGERVRMLCTADRVLRARYALMHEPDVAVRNEFERLLQDA